ncbi:MAG: helix-turn-helix domain-containing protein [Tannerella sp.]|nr:helix-turn-helix domain-containing protein [Tannerella sp.]
MIDDLVADAPYTYTFNLNMTVAVVCTKGYAKGRVNRKPYISQTPSITVSRPGEVLQYEQVSEDFSGFIVILSRRFADDLLTNMQERLSLWLAFVDTPCLPLNSRELKTALDYYHLLKKTQEVEAIPVRREIVKHLTLAFYYTMTYRLKILPDNVLPRKQEVLLERFMNLVREHFREQRNVGFYADRLCLTPKYLSKVIRNSSGASAGEWIDNYVMLEAKALLKSTNMTIQQISDELNFPSQSFFGKYFKRIAGVSPKTYRK